jgi:hypothetical protein
MSEKLHIPGSADGENLNELNMVIVLGWAACMLLCIALFLFFRGRRPEPALEGASPAAAARAGQDARAGEGDSQPKSPVEKAVEAFRFGPRDAAEAACVELLPKLARGEVSGAVDIELLKVLDRRARYAPWTCLLGAYLKDEISPDLQIHGELGQFWQQAQSFKVPARTMASVLRDFRASGERPENPEFYRWLRLCAMHPTYGARGGCLQILHQIAPAQGVDVLSMVEKHLQETEPETLAGDMTRVVAGLGDFATDGQPMAWFVEKTDAIANYNDALRIGAAFMLCRMVNSPDAEIAGEAAMALATAATMGARAADRKLVRRWRESCQYAFRDDSVDAAQAAEQVGEQDGEQGAGRNLEAVRALAVSDGDESTPPDYTLRGAVKRGGCPAEEARPAWYCGVRMWQGEKGAPFDRSLQKFFIKTSYVEWLDF